SLAAALAAVAVLGAGVGLPAPAAAATSTTTTPIKHFVYMLQGDRSFDNYFGTYPGADGIPDGVCQKVIVTGTDPACVKPYALHGQTPPYLGAGSVEINNQYDGGRMDGFVAAYQSEGRDGTSTMGYYDRRDLGTYWDLADNYVLFDKFFSSTRLGTGADRSYWVSANRPPTATVQAARQAAYAQQATIFDRLQAAGVDWKFYVQGYNASQNYQTVTKDHPSSQPLRVPLLDYARFVDDPALRSHIVDLSQYYRDLDQNTLPAVAYVASSGPSERSASSIAGGQKLVTDLVGSLMVSKYWTSSAFLLSYDGTGGWYDHVSPPQVDSAGYGLRVPALLVSAYARSGYIDPTVSDYTSGLAFIEHNWGLAPLAARDRSADPLTGAFDFGRPPRPPEVQFGQPTTTVPRPSHAVGIVYWCYGLALLVVVGTLVLASLRSRRTRRATPVSSKIESPDPVGALK
ncbi:MAG TPA: alkaline phosphatase family protein, partial [Jatrophihabitans sp.]|nr:alkaline phosphatase family protein [Jatrophihabitans sp.]